MLLLDQKQVFKSQRRYSAPSGSELLSAGLAIGIATTSFGCTPRAKQKSRPQFWGRLF